MKYLVILSASLFLNWIISCSGRPGSSAGNLADSLSSVKPAAEVPEQKLFSLAAPVENAELKLNQSFAVNLADISRNNPPDSVIVYFDGKLAGSARNSPWQLTIPASSTSRTGRKALKLTAFRNGRALQTMTRFLIVYSDTPPLRNGYQVIKTYPHDRNAFTQGLVFHDGYLYEGTGQENRSNLRKVKLGTGEVVNQLNLESHLFGEGIAILGEKIYQLTWQTKVGFVYDRNTFRLINRIYYQTEGWGLTAIENRLLMSDGSNILYFIEPDSFAAVSTLEVYDNKAKVSDLNELEYINGEIWANIWQTDMIARIDPKSGKVIAYIDLKGLLVDSGADPKPDVLNGIAYDAAGKRIFVTGKNWPKLFEIKIR